MMSQHASRACPLRVHGWICWLYICGVGMTRRVGWHTCEQRSTDFRTAHARTRARRDDAGADTRCARDCCVLCWQTGLLDGVCKYTLYRQQCVWWWWWWWCWIQTLQKHINSGNAYQRERAHERKPPSTGLTCLHFRPYFFSGRSSSGGDVYVLQVDNKKLLHCYILWTCKHLILRLMRYFGAI